MSFFIFYNFISQRFIPFIMCYFYFHFSMLVCIFYLSVNLQFYKIIFFFHDFISFLILLFLSSNRLLFVSGFKFATFITIIFFTCFFNFHNFYFFIFVLF